MTLQKLTVKLTGVSPLLMHNGQTADPLNPYSKALKAISGKRGKTDADFEEMAKVEWFSSLYKNKQDKIVLPDFVLEATFIAGAKKAKLGKQAQAGLFADGHAELIFDGNDLTPEQLFERDQNRHCCAVRVQRNKVMRTRSIFEDWEASVKVVFDDGMLDQAQVIRAIGDAGQQVGICDWRPKYGRFEVEVV